MSDERFMGLVLMSDNQSISSADLLEKIIGQNPSEENNIELIKAENETSYPSAYLLRFGNAIVSVMHVGAPAPKDAYEEALGKNRTWPQAASVLEKQQSHYIVSHLEEHDVFAERRDDAMAVLQVCAALCSNLSALGLNWVSSQTLTPALKISSHLKDLNDEDWPLMIFINFLPFGGEPNQEGQVEFGLLTKGLDVFVGREIHFNKTALDPEDLFNRTYSLGNYLLSNGAVLGDGDSVGLSEAEKIRVQYTTLEPNNIPLFDLTLEQVEGI
jgi:hypothetical protein